MGAEAESLPLVTTLRWEGTASGGRAALVMMTFVLPFRGL